MNYVVFLPKLLVEWRGKLFTGRLFDIEERDSVLTNFEKAALLIFESYPAGNLASHPSLIGEIRCFRPFLKSLLLLYQLLVLVLGVVLNLLDLVRVGSTSAL